MAKERYHGVYIRKDPPDHLANAVGKHAELRLDGSYVMAMFDDAFLIDGVKANSKYFRFSKNSWRIFDRNDAEIPEAPAPPTPEREFPPEEFRKVLGNALDKSLVTKEEIMSAATTTIMGGITSSRLEDWLEGDSFPSFETRKSLVVWLEWRATL